MRRSRRAVSLGAALALVVLTGAGGDSDKSVGERKDRGRKEKASLLFVANADAGTFAAGEESDATLELTGVDPDALFFTDRPERETGVITVTRMLNLLEESRDEGPPNAAIELLDDRTADQVLALELAETTYDLTTATLTFDARRLDSVDGDLEHLDDRLDEELPAEFGRVALFIDSSPFGSTNFCETQVQNYTEQNVTLESQSTWGTDTWDPAPPSNGFVLGLGASRSWQSDGGIGRGCHNSTTWRQDDGTTFTTSITDPYEVSDPNQISCTSSDPNGHPCHLDTRSTTRGASIDAIFYFCDNARQAGCPGQ
jgi:hypothetical protein